MTRPLGAGVGAASQAETIRPAYLVELDFESGFVRATTAPFTISFGGNDFLGVGDIGSISAVEETVEGRAHSVTFTLSGVKASLISTALGETYQGRPGKLWEAHLDGDDAIIGTPTLLFEGLMDTMPIQLSEGTATISMVIVSRFTRWERPVNNPRWDDADHQSRRPGDKFFEFVPEVVAGKEIIWGVA